MICICSKNGVVKDTGDGVAGDKDEGVEEVVSAVL